MIKMQQKKAITFLVLGALAVALTFGAIAYQSVLAATPTTSTNLVATSSSSSTSWAGGRGFNGGYTNQQLADALGITTDALSTAYQNAYSAALKEAVTQGLITQAQADELTTNGSAFPFGGRWDSWLSKNGIDFNTYQADALGISVDTLKAAYQTAFNTNIDQMLTAGSITQAQADLMKGKYSLYNNSTFQTSMQSAYTSAVKTAVTSGVITQAQADQLLSNSGDLFLWDRGGMGGHGGPRGHGDGGFMPDGNLPTTFMP